MKNKIAVRLILYFACAMLLFSVMIGGIFVWMFDRHSTKLRYNELETRAVRIASTMSEWVSSDIFGKGHTPGQGRGYGAYLRFIDDIAMSDVWLIDDEKNLITASHRNMSLSYNELPPDAEQIISQVLEGKTAFSESFSGLLEEKSLTVGAPILASDGQISGAVLLHSPIEGLSEARASQTRIFVISILAALAITAPLAVLLSLRFTKPLNIMKRNALLLSGGNYQAKNLMRQHDEIGELANNMDILADRLNESEKERQELEQMRQTFFTSVSHELRTPITVMRSSLEALCEKVVTDPEQVSEYLKQSLNESIHMQRLVNDLLELARLQNPSFSLEMSEIDLHETIGDAARSMRRIAAEKEISIECKGIEGYIAYHGDYNRLRQMFVIVLDNAIKFSDPRETVFIQGEGGADAFSVSISNVGKEISQEDLPHIFERFYKDNNTNNQQGTGLGLTIAKEIASRHGIQMSVENKENITKFIFSFPHNI